MRAALGLGLTLVLAARAHAVCADPTAPQVSPQHLQREDARVIEDQQRGLDREAPKGAPQATPAPPPALTATTVVTNRAMVATGGALLGVAALSALTALTLLPLDTTVTGDDQGKYDTLLKVFAATAAVSGLAGIVFLVSSRSTVQVAPAVTPRSVGLAITGRL
jgi:hypothetical protein